MYKLASEIADDAFDERDETSSAALAQSMRKYGFQITAMGGTWAQCATTTSNQPTAAARVELIRQLRGLTSTYLCPNTLARDEEQAFDSWLGWCVPCVTECLHRAHCRGFVEAEAWRRRVGLPENYSLRTYASKRGVRDAAPESATICGISSFALSALQRLTKKYSDILPIRQMCNFGSMNEASWVARRRCAR